MRFPAMNVCLAESGRGKILTIRMSVIDTKLTCLQHGVSNILLRVDRPQLLIFAKTECHRHGFVPYCRNNGEHLGSRLCTCHGATSWALWHCPQLQSVWTWSLLGSVVPLTATSTVLLAVCPQLQSVWTWSQGTENTGCCVRSASCHQIVCSPSPQQPKRDPVTAVHHHVRHRTLCTKPPNTQFMLRQFGVLMALCVEIWCSYGIVFWDLVFLRRCVLRFVTWSRAILRTYANVSETLAALIFRVNVILLWMWR